VVGIVYSLSQSVERHAGPRLLRLAVVLTLGLALGACSKCEVPNWLHTSPAPQTCHAGPDPQ
jgi:hypothetical protein